MQSQLYPTCIVYYLWIKLIYLESSSTIFSCLSNFQATLFSQLSFTISYFWSLNFLLTYLSFPIFYFCVLNFLLSFCSLFLFAEFSSELRSFSHFLLLFTEFSSEPLSFSDFLFLLLNILLSPYFPYFLFSFTKLSSEPLSFSDFLFPFTQFSSAPPSQPTFPLILFPYSLILISFPIFHHPLLLLLPSITIVSPIPLPLFLHRICIHPSHVQQIFSSLPRFIPVSRQLFATQHFPYIFPFPPDSIPRFSHQRRLLHLQYKESGAPKIVRRVREPGYTRGQGKFIMLPHDGFPVAKTRGREMGRGKERSLGEHGKGESAASQRWDVEEFWRLCREDKVQDGSVSK